MDDEPIAVYRRTYAKNPARYLLFPIGVIAVGLGILFLNAQLFDVSFSRASWANIFAGIIMLCAGVLNLWLACTRYTTWRRLLTILIGFLPFCAVVYSLGEEPPQGLPDIVVVATTMSLLTYVWMIAWRCKPADRQVEV